MERVAIDDRAEAIRKLAAEGLDADQIAAEQGISRSRVNYIVKRYGIAIWRGRRCYRKTAAQAVESVWSDLEHLVAAMSCSPVHRIGELTVEQCAEAADSLNASLPVLQAFADALADAARGGRASMP